MLDGTFAFTAGNARGPARAVRLSDGKVPDGVPPFACMGKTAEDVKAAADAAAAAATAEQPAGDETPAGD
ncbi:MAG: hypothetical protein R3C00_13255 [Hyphomonas sp.]